MFFNGMDCMSDLIFVIAFVSRVSFDFPSYLFYENVNNLDMTHG